MDSGYIVEILQELYGSSSYEVSETLYQDYNRITYHVEDSSNKDKKICKMIFAYNISPRNLDFYIFSSNTTKYLCVNYLVQSRHFFDSFQMILYTARDYSNFVVDKCLDPSLLPLTDLFLNVIYGLRSIHSCGLICGNISPSNIVFNEDYVFSICDSFENNLWLNSVIPAAKYRYISPEILNGKEPTNMSDIWSFGCLVYYCLTGGKNAFNGNNSDELPLSIINRNFDILNEYDNSELYIPIIEGSLNIKPNERMTDSEIVMYLEALNNKEDIIPYNVEDNVDIKDIKINYIDLLFFSNAYFSSLRYNNHIAFPEIMIEHVLKNEYECRDSIFRFLHSKTKSITDYVILINHRWNSCCLEAPLQVRYNNPVCLLIPLFSYDEIKICMRRNSLNPSYKDNVKIFSYSLFGLKQMQVLDLTSCGIDLDGVKILAKELKYLTSLEVLNLSNNNLTNESCEVLSESMKYLKSLQMLNLTGNGFDEEGIGLIESQLLLLNITVNIYATCILLLLLLSQIVENVCGKRVDRLIQIQ